MFFCPFCPSNRFIWSSANPRKGFKCLFARKSSGRTETCSHVFVVNSSGENKKCKADGLPLAASPAHFIKVYRHTSTSRGPLPPSLPPVVKTKCCSGSSPRTLAGGGMYSPYQSVSSVAPSFAPCACEPPI